MNKQTIIIGGLINEKSIKTENHIPILSDIPILGYFFKDQNNINRKSNLILMISPFILDNTNSCRKDHAIKKIKKTYNR